MDVKHNLNRLAYFVATVDAGTITGAAAKLNISKAVVSKQLQLLEEDVGTALLLRNTRNLQPTEAGQLFYQDSKSALTQANNAFERIQERDKMPRGLLRITAPVDYGVAYVAPFAARFRETYPDVTLDLHLTDQRVDIIEGRYDLSFRVGWLQDSSNLARKIMDFEEVAICSPRTFEKMQINVPEDLAKFPYVRSRVMSGHKSWAFSKDGEVRNIELDVVAELDITLAMRAFVTEGYAFTIMPDFLLQDELADGRLIRLLPDWSLRGGGVYTVTPPGRVRSNALQRFLELAHSEFGLRR